MCRGETLVVIMIVMIQNTRLEMINVDVTPAATLGAE